MGNAGVSTTDAEPGARAEPTADDLSLIRLMYEIVAAESRCGRCGAPLGRRLRCVLSSADRAPSWRVSVVTRCSGWRRHRHVADVAEASRDLSFGQFRPGTSSRSADSASGCPTDEHGHAPGKQGP